MFYTWLDLSYYTDSQPDVANLNLRISIFVAVYVHLIDLQCFGFHSKEYKSAKEIPETGTLLSFLLIFLVLRPWYSFVIF